MLTKPKPFCINRVLAGDKFARRYDLKEPQEWHYFKTMSANPKLLCVFNGTEDWYFDNGKLKDTIGIDDLDLVMLPKIKKLWIGVSKQKDAYGYYPTTCASEQEKDKALMDMGFIVCSIEMEVDE
jgi:hypothetical protein